MKALTAAEMREVDAVTTEQFGISGLQLTENAGRKTADAIWDAIAGRDAVSVFVLCGRGNNGGDGFVAARHLKEYGVSPRVLLFGKPEDLRGDAAKNLARWMNSGNKVEMIAEAADWERLWLAVSS